MKKLLKCIVAVSLMLALVDLTRAQLNLPETPGPPYADRWGNNRWGVKYDPRIHGRGRGPQSAPSSSGLWAGGRERNVPEELPPTRYRNNGGSAAPVSPLSKWIPGLKPLVSSIMKYTRRPRRPGPFDSTEHSVFRPPYSRRAVDGYVRNYMNRYNSVAQSPDYVNLQNYMRPTVNPVRNSFRPKNFGPIGNRPSPMSMIMRRSDQGVEGTSRNDVDKGILKDRFLNIQSSGSRDTPRYRTITKPQTGFNQSPPQISKKTNSVSTTRNFAKTLSKLYNDYNAGEENSGPNPRTDISSSSSSSNNSQLSASASTVGEKFSTGSSHHDDGYLEHHARPLYHFPMRGHSPQLRKRPSVPSRKRVPNFLERQYVSGGIGRKPNEGPPLYRGSYSFYRRPLSSSSPSGSLSSLDLKDDDYLSSHAGFSSSSSSPYDTIEYSDAPVVVHSSGSGDIRSSSFDDFPPSRPGTVKTYSTSGPLPPSSKFPSSVDSNDEGPDSFTNSFSAPPTNPLLASPPLSFPPSYASSPYLSPTLVITPGSSFNEDKYKTTKRKKKRFQHTPMNILRGLLGRNDRNDRDGKREQASLAVNIPLTFPGPIPPPQYSYNPIANSVPVGPLPYNSYLPHPGLPPPAPISPLAHTLTGPYYRPPQLPPPQKYPSPPNPPPGNNKIHAKNENVPGPGPIPKHVQDWPRIFTAMGTSADAVAGGIHAVRRELSKMTGQTLAKGIMMGGTAVHEVSKGMAHVISKMSSI